MPSKKKENPEAYNKETMNTGEEKQAAYDYVSLHVQGFYDAQEELQAQMENINKQLEDQDTERAYLGDNGAVAFGMFAMARHGVSLKEMGDFLRGSLKEHDREEYLSEFKAFLKENPIATVENGETLIHAEGAKHWGELYRDCGRQLQDYTLPEENLGNPEELLAVKDEIAVLQIFGAKLTPAIVEAQMKGGKVPELADAFTEGFGSLKAMEEFTADCNTVKHLGTLCGMTTTAYKGEEAISQTVVASAFARKYANYHYDDYSGRTLAELRKSMPDLSMSSRFTELQYADQDISTLGDKDRDAVLRYMTKREKFPASMNRKFEEMLEQYEKDFFAKMTVEETEEVTKSETVRALNEEFAEKIQRDGMAAEHEELTAEEKALAKQGFHTIAMMVAGGAYANSYAKAENLGIYNQIRVNDKSLWEHCRDYYNEEQALRGSIKQWFELSPEQQEEFMKVEAMRAMADVRYEVTFHSPQIDLTGEVSFREKGQALGRYEARKANKLLTAREWKAEEARKRLPGSDFEEIKELPALETVEPEGSILDSFTKYDLKKGSEIGGRVLFGILGDTLSEKKKVGMLKNISYFALEPECYGEMDRIYRSSFKGASAKLKQLAQGEIEEEDLLRRIDAPILSLDAEKEDFAYFSDKAFKKPIEKFLSGMKELLEVMEEKEPSLNLSSPAEKKYYELMRGFVRDIADGSFSERMLSDPSYRYTYTMLSKLSLTSVSPTADENLKFTYSGRMRDDRQTLHALEESGILDAMAGAMRLKEMEEAQLKRGEVSTDELTEEYRQQFGRMQKALGLDREEYEALLEENALEGAYEEFGANAKINAAALRSTEVRAEALEAGFTVRDLSAIDSYQQGILALEEKLAESMERYEHLRNRAQLSEEEQEELSTLEKAIPAYRQGIKEMKDTWQEIMQEQGLTEPERNEALDKMKRAADRQQTGAADSREALAAASRGLEERLGENLTGYEKARLTNSVTAMYQLVDGLEPSLTESAKLFSAFKKELKELADLQKGYFVHDEEWKEAYRNKLEGVRKQASAYLQFRERQNDEPEMAQQTSEADTKCARMTDAVFQGLGKICYPESKERVAGKARTVTGAFRERISLEAQLSRDPSMERDGSVRLTLKELEDMEPGKKTAKAKTKKRKTPELGEEPIRRTTNLQSLEEDEKEEKRTRRAEEEKRKEKAKSKATEKEKDKDKDKEKDKSKEKGKEKSKGKNKDKDRKKLEGMSELEERKRSYSKKKKAEKESGTVTKTTKREYSKKKKAEKTI